MLRSLSSLCQTSCSLQVLLQPQQRQLKHRFQQGRLTQGPIHRSTQKRSPDRAKHIGRKRTQAPKAQHGAS